MDGTWTVPELTEHVRAVLQAQYGDLWIEGEIADLSRSSAGHVYFTLVEPGADRRGAEHSLAVTLFDSARQRVNLHIRRSGASMRMANGVRVRIRGSLDLYAARSSLQLKMSGIDPTFTMGALAADRERVLAALAADGLIGANARTSLPFLPRRVAVVTSIGSAAHADVLHELSSSAIGLELVVIDARVQGDGAVEQLVAALAKAVTADAELIALVRGGGSRTDLVAFDHEHLARAIAASPVPVLAGIGHEIDRSVADEVCHTSFKTPTACAAAIVALAVAGHTDLEAAWQSIGSAATERLRRHEERNRHAGLRLGAACRGGLVASLSALDHAHDRFGRATRARLATDAALIDRAGAVLRAHDPAVALRRGWSITRTADGRLARAAAARSGDELITSVADGTISSTVSSDPVAISTTASANR